MTTNHNLHSDQDSLLVVLERLAYKGAIRQLDYQFACFIDSQTHDEQSDSQALAFIAGVVSSELGKGHICLPLFDAQGQSTDLASKLGLFGESALALNTQLQGIDWIQVLKKFHRGRRARRSLAADVRWRASVSAPLLAL